MRHFLVFFGIKKKRLTPLLSRIFVLFCILFLVSACDGGGGPGKIPCPNWLPGCNNDTGTDIPSHPIWIFVSAFIKWIITISATGAVLVCVVSGIMLVYAGGNEDFKKKGTRTFLFAGLGLLLSLFSYIIVTLVDGIFTDITL